MQSPTPITPGPAATRIVLVDDEAYITATLAGKLRAEGFEVHIGRDGVEGLELARRVRPAVVVSDFQMPRLSGVELARALCADPLTTDAHVLLLTARGHAIPPADLAATRVRQVVAKPFSAREIVAAVRKWSAVPPATEAA